MDGGRVNPGRRSAVAAQSAAPTSAEGGRSTRRGEVHRTTQVWRAGMSQGDQPDLFAGPAARRAVPFDGDAFGDRQDHGQVMPGNNPRPPAGENLDRRRKRGDGNTLCDKVAEHFESRPDTWIDGKVI